MSERECLLKKIMVAYFAAHDTALFLDTHPNCKSAIADHKKYVAEINKLKAEYQQKYGMLNIYSESDPDCWDWIKAPWPWQQTWPRQ